MISESRTRLYILAFESRHSTKVQRNPQLPALVTCVGFHLLQQFECQTCLRLRRQTNERTTRIKYYCVSLSSRGDGDSAQFHESLLPFDSCGPGLSSLSSRRSAPSPSPSPSPSAVSPTAALAPDNSQHNSHQRGLTRDLFSSEEVSFAVSDSSGWSGFT